MNQKYRIPNAILWAAAIIASAIMGAPTFLTLALLPLLAVISLILTGDKCCAPETR